MSQVPNGHQDGFRPYRPGPGPDHSGSLRARPPAPAFGQDSGHSGRRLVVVACLTILMLWGSIYLVFRDWRQRYRVRASLGATQVAPVVDALAESQPPGVDAQAWRDAVRETHAMLVSVTAANLLDLKQMEALRDELKQIVDRARNHPETACDELASIWNAMADRAEFVLQEGTSGRKQGHPRPAILPPREGKAKATRPAHISPSETGLVPPS